MATYYWVPSGGSSSGNWNSTTTTNWSMTSGTLGGVGGFGPPVTGDDVIFDGGSDSGATFTVTVVATGPTIRDLTVSGLDQSMVLAGNVGMTIQGAITLPASGFTWSLTGGLTLSGATSKTLTTNGVTINGAVTMNAAGGTWTLGSALTLGSTRSLTLTAGTFDSAGYALTTGNFISTNSNTRSVTLGSSTVTIADSATAWNFATTTNLTFSGASSTIVMTSASAKTFSGGGLTYGKLTHGGGGIMTISGSNTFSELANSAQPVAVRFTTSTTQTVTTFSYAGTAGNLVTIDSTTATVTATLSKASGTVNASYLSIRDSTATGGATWNASNSTDVSGNTGWNFGAAGAATGNFFMFF